MTQNQNSSNQDEPVNLQQKIEEAKKSAAKQEEPSSTSTGSSGDPQAAQITELQSQLQSMTEMAKRTMADLQNLKRRQADERHQTIILANIDLIRDLIPIVDNLDRAKQHLPETISKDEKNAQWFKGIEICANQLHKLLEDSGVKPIESIGQPFNPDLHEALAQGPGPKDTVIEELEKGYMLGDRVIRHAKVKVGNGE